MESLRGRRADWKKTLDAMARKRRAELAAYRAPQARG